MWTGTAAIPPLLVHAGGLYAFTVSRLNGAADAPVCGLFPRQPGRPDARTTPGRPRPHVPDLGGSRGPISVGHCDHLGHYGAFSRAGGGCIRTAVDPAARDTADGRGAAGVGRGRDLYVLAAPPPPDRGGCGARASQYARADCG